jgi:propanol-preferring alcohol dehydrogenase
LPLAGRHIIPGHQIVGRVDGLGAGVTDLAAGDLVGVTWLAGACGRCEYCRSDRENLCPEATFTGYHRDGGYAEFVLARAAFTARLPVGVPAVEAAPLLCAGVVGYRAVRLSGIRPGERLGLVGFGASAHLMLQVARAQACEVRVFTRGEHHRRQALALGAAWAGDLAGGEPADCHAIVLFAPVGHLVPDCLRHLRPGGTLAINAVHLTDIPSLPYERLFGERVLRSVSHVTRRDAVEFLELAARAGIRADVRVYPFTAANEALLAVKNAEIEGQAVLDIGGTAGGGAGGAKP